MEPKPQPSASSASANIKLNEIQSAALSAIFEFLDSDDRIFILNGAAGTGKTTLVKSLCNRLGQAKVSFELAATTGRAAKVLSAKTGQQAKTLHSMLYTFDEVSGSASEGQDPWASETGQLFLSFGVRTADVEQHPAVFIIDEASMISHLPANEGHTAPFWVGYVIARFATFCRCRQNHFCGRCLPVASQIG